MDNQVEAIVEAILGLSDDQFDELMERLDDLEQRVLAEGRLN